MFIVSIATIVRFLAKFGKSGEAASDCGPMTRSELHYATRRCRSVGNAMGREIVCERRREVVKADLARTAGLRDYKR
jgi:hypothetical protein